MCFQSRSAFLLSCLAILPAERALGGDCDPQFLRGDTNEDGELDLSDGIHTLSFLFVGGKALSCLDSADSNDSGDLDLSDPIHIFTYLFAGGSPPPSPGPAVCGLDSTLDGLSSCSHAPCPEDCGCIDGEERACGSSGEGECRLGIQVCRDGRWGSCTGNVEPAEESCDGFDNDCDGKIDDGFELLGQPCDGEDADLCANGTYTCTNGGFSMECLGESGPGREEICDGEDNDCNGLVDEGFDLDGDGWKTCAGDCDDSNASANPGKTFDPIDGADNDCDGSIDEGPITTAYERDIQPIWDGHCTTPFCHDSTIPTGGLDLSPGDSYRNLVDRVSLEAPRLDRVEPQRPDRSYLWHKLNGTQASVGGSGGSMPLGRALLPQATRTLIQTWIQEGAPR